MSETYKIVDGDWVLDAAGRPAVVTDNAKLSQDLNELLSIETQPTGFGAGLVTLLGREIDAFQFRLLATRQVRAAVGALMRLQDDGTVRSPTERVALMHSFVVSPAAYGDARTAYRYVLHVRSRAGVDRNVEGSIS